MEMKSARTNLPLLLIVLVAAAAMSTIGWQRIRIDTDIVSSLPQGDPVIKDAMHLFSNHPLQDQLTIDVGLDRDDPDLLVECGEEVEQALRGERVVQKRGYGGGCQRFAGTDGDCVEKAAGAVHSPSA